MAAIRSNILLLISFFLAMMSILACSLIQQWCREFMKYAYPRAAPHKRGRVRTYLFQGLNRFYIKRFTYGVHVIVHISVFLFFCGLSDYLHDIYPRVGMVSWYCVFTLMMVYATLGVFPLFIGNCPYQTALTPPLLFGSTLLLFFCRTAWRRLCRGQGALPRREERAFDKSRYFVEKANAEASHLDPYALKWLFTDDDFSDTKMDKFLEGLPGYIHSHFTVTEELPEVLTAPYILQRIREHLLTCVTATELSEQARIKRVSTCVEFLRVIIHLRISAGHIKNADDDSLRAYLQSIIDVLNSLCDKPDKIRDLRAFCVRALLFQGILTKCLEPTRVGSPNIKLPSHFLPMFTFFSWIINTPQEQQAHAEVSDEMDEDTKWRVLLHDGPFINLTLLAEAILSQDDLGAATLSMCWKTLDILRSGLQINRADISDSSLRLFNLTHTKTLSHVESEEPGFSVIPLLEILDAVDGGRRLSMVFQDHPKYRSKGDLVFGKDHLRNPDLFHAFASCLPHFVSKHPDKLQDFMEGLVLYDHLWISLQAHLLESLRPNTFIPATIRVFDTCCTVIDMALVALEKSQRVDLRTPDFGSLAHYFEIYVTDCFQGMFIERAIGFRVALIKARFCNAILAQFLDEFSRKGTVVFRSHWDVASLARVFYSLGVGDVEFWSSLVDGGPIGEVLMANTYAALEVAQSDGPLLNFCRLVQLGMMAVPFEGSGLKKTDFKKLLDLMQKMTEEIPLPLVHDSNSVWEELHRLRDEVADICEKISNEDQAHMEGLLMQINEVYRRRPSSTHEHFPIDHVLQAEASGTSAVVQPQPSSKGLLIYENYRSTPIEDQHDGSPIQEVDFGGTVFHLTEFLLDNLTDDCLNIPGAIPARSSNLNARSEFLNFYRNPYPLLPSQIDHRGAITRPFSASFLPDLSPHSGGTDVVSSGVLFAHPTLRRHMRYNTQHRHSTVYYPPKGDAITNRLPAMLSLRSPERALATSSNKWFGHL